MYSCIIKLLYVSTLCMLQPDLPCSCHILLTNENSVLIVARGQLRASEGIIERPICPTQILILPLNRPLAACFMGLFSTRHFECCSVHRPSFPRMAFPLSPCPCLSPSRLRGLVRLPETEHHSVRMRLPKAPPRQEGAGHWLYDNNYCLLSMSFGGLFFFF